jgi:hypothetical protein
MRVGFWGLSAWSFLMATGHGAGLMLLPFFSAAAQPVSAFHMGGMGAVHGAGVTGAASPGIWVGAVAVHTFGYLLTMIAVAWVVFTRLGVKILRTAWFNFDLAWAIALVLSGALMLILPRG